MALAMGFRGMTGFYASLCAQVGRFFSSAGIRPEVCIIQVFEELIIIVLIPRVLCHLDVLIMIHHIVWRRR